MNHNLRTLFRGRTRLYLHLGSIAALFFLVVYNLLVCPFMNGLGFVEMGMNLGIVLVFQIILREILFRRFATPREEISLSRQGYLLSVITWCLSGLFALFLVGIRYENFPHTSYFKLLSAYLVLGGGIQAQLEYVILEQAERLSSQEFNSPKNFLERITRRIMEGYFLFTLAPAFLMLLVVMRYVFEGFVDKVVVFEVATIGVFCLVLALRTAVIYGKRLKSDTQEIIEAIQKIERGNINVILQVNRFDELGEMTHGVNRMAEGLRQRERIKEAFGRFVTPAVAEEFIEKYIRQGKQFDLGGQRREVVILMSDIRNFTPLAESMPGEELTQLLNGYFSEMVQAIQNHGGIVDKFIGDAVMAVFGFMETQANGALDAVKAAMEMQERLARYNEENEIAGKPRLTSGIGIHVGDVIAGYIGSEERLEFTVIGSPVNIAARIESHAKAPNPPILFSREVADRLGSEIQTSHIGATALKGVSKEVDLYGVGN